MRVPKMKVQMLDIEKNLWLNVDDGQEHNFGGFISLAERIHKNFRTVTRVVAVEKNSIFNSVLWDSRSLE